MAVEEKVQFLKKWEQHFKSEGWSGNGLVDLLELTENLRNFGVQLTEGGQAILYHATSEDNACQILNEQQMFGLEDGLFFSTSPDGEIVGYGSTVLKVWIPIPLLELNDDFRSEQRYRVPVRPKQRYSSRVERY